MTKRGVVIHNFMNENVRETQLKAWHQDMFPAATFK